MKGRLFLAYTFLIVFFVACQNQETGFGIASKEASQAYSSETAFYEDDETALNEAPPQQDAGNTSQDTTQRKLIKTANIRFQVKDLDVTIEQIEKIVSNQNALVVTSNLQNNSYQLAYQLTIRVPSSKFLNLVDSISNKAEVLDTKEISAQDVTAEFVDINARLKAKNQIETRYLEILKEASNVTDILEVEKKLGEIREEIEATEGRLKYLKNQVSLSTINLYVYQLVDEKNNQLQPSFFSRVGKGFGEGWGLFLNFIVSLSYSWPFIIVIITSIFIIRKWIIKRKKKKKAISDLQK